MHQPPDQSLANADAASLNELDAHSSGPLRDPVLGMDVGDRRPAPLAAHYNRQHRLAPMTIGALTGGPQDFAVNLAGSPGVDEDDDHRVNNFGCWAELRDSALARRRISTSYSKSRNLRLVLRNSRDSARETPSILPRSIRSCFTQP